MKTIQGYYHNRLLWFRIFGKGLIIKDIRFNPLLFSERNGYAKGLKVGNLYIGLLS